MEIEQIIEAILYVAGEPVALRDLARALEQDDAQILSAVRRLEA